MPLYDYRCTACQATFERLVKAGAEPDCPHCGSTRLERQVALTAPQMQTPKILRRARQQAAREGHFSHYAPSERPKP